jgi:hypothetical protein
MLGGGQHENPLGNQVVQELGAWKTVRRDLVDGLANPCGLVI